MPKDCQIQQENNQLSSLLLGVKIIIILLKSLSMNSYDKMTNSGLFKVLESLKRQASLQKLDFTGLSK